MIYSTKWIQMLVCAAIMTYTYWFRLIWLYKVIIALVVWNMWFVIFVVGFKYSHYLDKVMNIKINMDEIFFSIKLALYVNEVVINWNGSSTFLVKYFSHQQIFSKAQCEAIQIVHRQQQTTKICRPHFSIQQNVFKKNNCQLIFHFKQKWSHVERALTISRWVVEFNYNIDCRGALYDFWKL